jgi:signal peptidase I
MHSIPETPTPNLENPMVDKPSGKHPVRSFMMEILQTLLLAAALYFAIDALVARVRVENVSMKPTLVPDEFLLVSKLAYRLGKPDYGDIVVFHFPGNPSEDYIKRVIGLPGDVVRVESGIVYVNDFPLMEPYLAESPDYGGTWSVPDDSIFVLGDNRNQSSDSHAWGFVPKSYLVGKAFAIYWPFDVARILNNPHIVNAANQ